MKCKLEEVCSYIARGITPKYSDNSNFYVMNQKCIRNSTVSFVNSRQHDYTEKKVSTDKILHLYDILVNSTGVGTAGRVAQLKSIPDNYLGITVDSHVTIVRPDPKLIYPEYLGYFLQYKQPSIESLAKGSTGQTEISRSSIVSVEIDLPDLDTQKKIVRILSALDQKIELNNQQNEKLMETALSFYRDLRDKQVEKWEFGYIGDGKMTKIEKSGVPKYYGIKKYVATADVTDTIITHFEEVSYNEKPSRANMLPKRGYYLVRKNGRKCKKYFSSGLLNGSNKKLCFFYGLYGN